MAKINQRTLIGICIVLALMTAFEYVMALQYKKFAEEVAVPEALTAIGNSRLSGQEKQKATDRIFQQWPISGFSTEISKSSAMPIGLCDRCDYFREEWQDSNDRCGTNNNNTTGACTQRTNWARAFSNSSCFSNCGNRPIYDQ